MTLMQRKQRVEPVRPETLWPTWLSNRSLVDWPSWAMFADGPEMKVEEFTDGDRLVIRAELPGIDPDKDVEITVSDHTLTIRAERRREEQVEDKDGYRSEFEYGSFVRSLTLPSGAGEADVEATYSDGILEVRVPVAAETEARKVPVTRN